MPPVAAPPVTWLTRLERRSNAIVEELCKLYMDYRELEDGGVLKELILSTVFTDSGLGSCMIKDWTILWSRI